MVSRNFPLAVLSPTIGLPSETFIRRHIEDIYPGKTVVVTHRGQLGESEAYWTVDCPIWDLSAYHVASTWTRIGRRLHRYFGGDPKGSSFRRFVQKHGVTTILGEYLDFSISYIDIASELGLRFFGHAHGYDVSLQLRDSYWQNAYKKYNSADGLIAVSRISRERLIALGIHPEKVTVIPCGVAVPEEPRRHGLGKEIRCVAVGRMVTKKGPMFTLDAFRRAVAICPELRLEYIGDGPLLPAAKQFVGAFCLEDKVTFHGAKPHSVVQCFLENADIFVQHSLTDSETGDEEGLPVAVLEGMANALPIVSTVHAGIPDAVEPGVTGYLVSEGDSVAMGEALVELAQHRKLRTKMGNAGWARARESFSVEREREKLLDVMGLR